MSKCSVACKLLAPLGQAQRKPHLQATANNHRSAKNLIYDWIGILTVSSTSSFMQTCGAGLP